MKRAAPLAIAIALALAAGPALAQSGAMQSGGMKMPMAMPEGPSHFKPTRQAYMTDHRFLIKLLSVPGPIPYEKYFELRFAVYDGHHPTKRLDDADLETSAGMRHGLKHGFAHGMQSSPKVEKKDGAFTVSGMYFHMMGPWVLKMTVREGGKQGVAYFRLPCCGK